jgi:tryptophan synthase beta chain
VAYQQFNDGTMTDYIPTDEDLAKGLAFVPPQPEE